MKSLLFEMVEQAAGGGDDNIDTAFQVVALFSITNAAMHDGRAQIGEATRQMKMSIFVLADTHNKLPQKIVDLAREADEIWHLGDVCEPTISGDLEAIGTPVTIVRGNCDCNSEWPLVVDLRRGGL